MAYFREFTSFWQTFNNKKLRPIGSSNFGDILTVIMFDVCFKMTKNTFWKVAFERTLKNVFFCHFKAHIKHYDDQNVTKSWGINWLNFFIFESLSKTCIFAEISKNVRNFLIFSTLKELLNNPKSMIHSRKNTAVKR